MRTSDLLVSSVRTDVRGEHAHMSIWVRGGKAGTLAVPVKLSPS